MRARSGYRPQAFRGRSVYGRRPRGWGVRGGYNLYDDGYDADEDPYGEEVWGELEGEADENVLRNALRTGERDENRLSDLIFFNRHPERVDAATGTRKLIELPAEQTLAAEWRTIRASMVRPALAATLVPAPQVVPRLLAALPRHAQAFSVPADDVARLKCVLTKLSARGPDELVLLRDVRTSGSSLGGPTTFIRQHVSSESATWLQAGMSDVSMVEQFRRTVDDPIKANVDWIVLQVISAGPGGRVDPGIRNLANFISGGHRDPRSIYSCYEMLM